MKKLKPGYYEIKPDKYGKPTVYNNKKDNIFIQIVKAIIKAIKLIVTAVLIIVASIILYFVIRFYFK